MENQKKLEKLILERARGECRYSDLSQEMKLMDDLGYDSLSLIELCVAIEEMFGFEMDDIDRIDTLSVGNLMDMCIKAMD